MGEADCLVHQEDQIDITVLRDAALPGVVSIEPGWEHNSEDDRRPLIEVM